MTKKTRRELIEEYGKVSAVVRGKRIALETGKGHKIELSFFNSIKYSILSKISVLFNNSVQSLLHKQYRLYDGDKPKVIKEKLFTIFHKHEYVEVGRRKEVSIVKCKHCNKELEIKVKESK